MSDVLIVICFSLLIIVSLGGNCLVCRTLFRQRRFCANSTNVLIGMLSISDLMMTTFNIPFTVVDIILNDWIFGDFFCILVSFVQANSVYVSSFTMAVIAIDRCKAIYKFKPKTNDDAAPNCNNTANSNSTVPANHNLNNNNIGDGSHPKNANACCLDCCCLTIKCPWINKSTTANLDNKTAVSPNSYATGNNKTTRFKLELRTKMILIISGIWVMAVLHALPHTIFNRVSVVKIDVNQHQPAFNNQNTGQMNQLPSNKTTKLLRRCIPMIPEWFGENFSLWLTLYTTATQYIIPLSIAAIIYTRIAFTINSQGKVGQMSETRAERINKHKRRRLLMLALIVAIFALCWLPFNVYYLLLDFGITKSYNHTAFLICLWLATSSVCYNPFVYCWLNKSFRREAKMICNRFEQLCCCCCSRSANDNNNNNDNTMATVANNNHNRTETKNQPITSLT